MLGTNRGWDCARYERIHDCVACKRGWLALTLQVHGRLWPNLLPARHTPTKLVPMHTLPPLGMSHAGGSQHAAQHLQQEGPLKGSWLASSRTKQQHCPPTLPLLHGITCLSCCV